MSLWTPPTLLSSEASGEGSSRQEWQENTDSWQIQRQLGGTAEQGLQAELWCSVSSDRIVCNWFYIFGWTRLLAKATMKVILFQW